MDPERWHEVERIFYEALDRPAQARADFLARRCGADARLRTDVERLLALDATDDDLIARFGALPEGIGQRPDPLIGRQVGSYRLVARIAAGGMGVVYRAVRVDGLYEREVAVKLVRSEVPSEVALRRFDLERRLLASLDHPHIARLYDGGTTPEGTPYLVMEYVHGRPIDRWCDEKHLALAQRLELFAVVCRTVHFAHENLIVHGDLKPPNVLVDETGAVKLLDFGLSRLLESAEKRAPVERTATLARLLTPEYASPEQWRGEPLTASADVYSLGVVLYVLLTGSKPLSTAHKSAGQWERTLLEETAIRPSARVARRRGSPRGPDEPTPEAVAASQGTTPERLARLLRGDLDRITLMALHKEPARRYPSAAALAEDVERHLRGLPVRAREDSLSYRTWTFVRRNRLAVAAGTAVLVAPSAALVFSLRAEGHARRDAEHARIEAESFRQIADLNRVAFLAARHEPPARQIDTLRAKVMDQAEHVRRRFATQRHLQANLLDALGLFCLRAGLGEDEASALMQEARALRELEFGPRSLEIALSLRSLADLEQHAGHPERAVQLLEQALALHRGASEVHTDVALAATELATVLFELGRHEEARPLFEEALALRRARLGARAPPVADSLEALARVLLAGGEAGSAAACLREALEIRGSTLGESDEDTVRTRQFLGSLTSRPAAEGAAPDKDL